MKLRLATLSILLAVFWIAAVALADKGGNGKARGYPNHGISSPGVPNHYGSPRGWEHP